MCVCPHGHVRWGRKSNNEEIASRRRLQSGWKWRWTQTCRRYVFFLTTDLEYSHPIFSFPLHNLSISFSLILSQHVSLLEIIQKKKNKVRMRWQRYNQMHYISSLITRSDIQQQDLFSFTNLILSLAQAHTM